MKSVTMKKVYYTYLFFSSTFEWMFCTDLMQNIDFASVASMQIEVEDGRMDVNYQCKTFLVHWYQFYFNFKVYSKTFAYLSTIQRIAILNVMVGWKA